MERLLRLGLASMLWSSVPSAIHACGGDALGTSRTLVVGTLRGPQIGLRTYPHTLPLADHEVVLTFDDGPGATTPAVLAALQTECVKATFFLVGRNAEASPATVKRELTDGHTLGHHSYSHPAQTLRCLSFDAATNDIARGIKADEIAAYGTASDTPRVPLFRFPGFADTPELDAWLASRNIAVFGTDLWANDWLELTAQQELGILMRQLEKAGRGIILLHDTRASTARMLPTLLRALKAGGYRIVHIVPGRGRTATISAPGGWSSTTEKIIPAALARLDAGGRRRLALAFKPPARVAMRRVVWPQRPRRWRGVPLTAMHPPAMSGLRPATWKR